MAIDITKEQRALEQATKRAVAERIKELRRATGLNQEQFASQAQLYRSHYGFVESERREPKLGTLIRIANGLGMSLSDLVAVDPEQVEHYQREFLAAAEEEGSDDPT